MGLSQLLRKIDPAILAALNQQEAPEVNPLTKRLRLVEPQALAREPMSEEYSAGSSVGSSTQIPASFKDYLRQQSPTIAPVEEPQSPMSFSRLAPQPNDPPPAQTTPTNLRSPWPAVQPVIEEAPPTNTPATRLRHVVPPQALIEATQRASGGPVETDAAASGLDIAERPLGRLRSLSPGLTPTSRNESRVREVNPPDELTKSIAAYHDRERAPLYDPDENGQIKKPSGAGSRLKAALKMALQGFVGGGLPGAIGGAIGGAVDPTMPAKFRRQQQLAEAGQRLKGDLGVAKAQTDLETDRTLNEYRRVQMRKAMQPKVTYPRDAQGRVLKVTQVEGQPDKVEVVSNVTKTVAPNTQWADGKLLIFNPETRHYEQATDINGQPITDQLKTPTKFTINGVTYNVSPNTAAIATATGQRFEISQAATESRFNRSEVNQNARDEKRDTRADDKEAARREEADRKAAAAAIARINGLRRQAEVARAQRSEQETEDEAAAKAEAFEIQAEAEEEALRAQYGDYVQGGSFGGVIRVPIAGSTRPPLMLKPRAARSTALASPSPTAPQSKPKGKLKRSTFVTNNPQYKGKSEAEIDAAIRGGGYLPY